MPVPFVYLLESQRTRFYSAQLGLAVHACTSTREAMARVELQAADSHDLRRIYNTVDENGDGVLTVREIHQFLEKLGIQMSEEAVYSIVSPLCRNGDGSLAFEEFASFCRSIGEESEEEYDTEERREDLMEAFRIFDKNRDGYISPTDLQQILFTLGFPQGRELADCQKMICTFDEDCNGLLDFSEFQNMMTSNLSLVANLFLQTFAGEWPLPRRTCIMLIAGPRGRAPCSLEFWPWP